MPAEFLPFVVAAVWGSLPVSLWVAKAQGLRDLRLVGDGRVDSDAVAEHLSLVPAGLIAFFAEMILGAGAAVYLNQVSPESALGAWLALWIVVLVHRFNPWLKGRGGNAAPVLAGGLVVLAPLSISLGVAIGGLFYLSKLDFKSARLVGLGSALLAFAIFHQNGWATTLFFLSLMTVLIGHRTHLDEQLEA